MHTAYTDAIGRDLGIIGAEIDFDIETLKPEIRVVFDAGKPVIKWKKGPHADGLNIYVDREDGKGFVLLATDMRPDYIDETPLPEGATSVRWTYKAVYVINDKETGQFSDQVVIALPE